MSNRTLIWSFFFGYIPLLCGIPDSHNFSLSTSTIHLPANESIWPAKTLKVKLENDDDDYAPSTESLKLFIDAMKSKARRTNKHSSAGHYSMLMFSIPATFRATKRPDVDKPFCQLFTKFAIDIPHSKQWTRRALENAIRQSNGHSLWKVKAGPRL